MCADLSSGDSLETMGFLFLEVVLSPLAMEERSMVGKEGR
jgi:hypothetical protein